LDLILKLLNKFFVDNGDESIIKISNERGLEFENSVKVK